MTAADPTEPLLVMTRVIDAPRAVVFEQWSKPARLARWWDPGGGASPAEVEIRPGGAFRFRIRGRGGQDRWLRVVLRELVRPERIVFTWGGELAETETLISVTFTEDGRKTRLVLQQAVSRPDVRRPNVWDSCLERLEAYVTGARLASGA
jgi:uncharacterized protein YndB with AHSA1/START domain